MGVRKCLLPFPPIVPSSSLTAAMLEQERLHHRRVREVAEHDAVVQRNAALRIARAATLRVRERREGRAGCSGRGERGVSGSAPLVELLCDLAPHLAAAGSTSCAIEVGCNVAEEP